MRRKARMYFKVRSQVFEKAALGDLRDCCDALLDRTGAYRTSLGHHLGDAGARGLVMAAARRFYECELPRLFADRFGSVPALNLGFTTIRRQEAAAEATRVGWHLDLNFADDDAPFMVAWVPMEDVGTARIGLEVCTPKRPIDLAPLLADWRRRRSAGERLVFQDDELAALLGDDTFEARALHLSAGDAAVFDQRVLHRTQFLPQASEPRRSFEFRMVDLRALPKLSAGMDGVFCRRDDGEPDGIGFVVKVGRTFLRTEPSALDGLEVSVSSNR